MTLNQAFSGLVAILFTSTSFAAAPVSQTQQTDTVQQTVQAQDSANGSMTDQDLTGNVNADTSQLQQGTTSGTTQGAIVDQSQVDRKKKRKKKSQKTEQIQQDTTTSQDPGSMD